MLKALVLSLLLMGGLSMPTSAGTIYNESVEGDFSSSGNSPTSVALSNGTNQILGSNGSGASSVRDYVTISIPSGLMLTSITLQNTALGAKGFLGIESGDVLTLPLSTMTAAGLLGWWHYTPADIDTDILAKMALPANGSTGFTPPLQSGDYTLWIQDSSAGTFNYGFTIELTATPEPATFQSSLGVLIFGLLTYGVRRRFSIAK